MAPKTNPSHKRKKQPRHTPRQPTVSTRPVVSVGESGSSKLPARQKKKSSSKTPADALTTYLSSKQPNKRVQLEDDSTFLLFLRDVFIENVESPTPAPSLDLRDLRSNFDVRYREATTARPKRLASASTAPVPSSKRLKSSNSTSDADADAAADVLTSLALPPSDALPEPTFTLDSLNMRRLLIEDMLLLRPGDQVMVLVSPEHVSYPTTFRTLLDRRRFPLAPVCFGTWRSGPPVTFYQLPGMITRNPTCDNIIHGHYDRSAFQQQFTLRVGRSLSVVFSLDTVSIRTYDSISSLPRDAPGIEIKFAELYFSCETIHLWSEQPQRRNFYRMALRIKRNPNSCAALYFRLRQELFGDRFQLLELSQAMQKILDDTKVKRSGSASNTNSSSVVDVSSPTPKPTSNVSSAASATVSLATVFRASTSSDASTSVSAHLAHTDSTSASVPDSASAAASASATSVLAAPASAPTYQPASTSIKGTAADPYNHLSFEGPAFQKYESTVSAAYFIV